MGENGFGDRTEMAHYSDRCTMSPEFSVLSFQISFKVPPTAQPLTFLKQPTKDSGPQRTDTEQGSTPQRLHRDTEMGISRNAVLGVGSQ